MAHPRKPDEEKYCQACHKRLHRQRFNGVLESNLAFSKRKYCNRLCMAAAMMKDQPTLAALRKRAIQFRGKICEYCGTTESVGIHHMDIDPSNNDPSNLKTLCSSCHTSWHWSQGNHRHLIMKPPRPCSVCGRVFLKLKRDMCQKHFQRYKKYGDPLLTKKKHGSHYVLVREAPGAVNGQESQELRQA